MRAKLTPESDESLMSFLARSALSQGIPWTVFCIKTRGYIILYPRETERSAWDFEQLATIVGLSKEELYGMSERSLLLAEDRGGMADRFWVFHLPWMDCKGYPAYSPSQLKWHGRYLRRAWLRPDALVDAETGTLHLRHCWHCHCEIGAHRQRIPLACCSECSAPYSSAPEIEAPAEILAFAEGYSSVVEREYARRPIAFRSRETMKLALGWRISRALAESRFAGFGETVVAEAGLGRLEGPQRPGRGFDLGRAAIRHAQLLAAGWHIVETHPQMCTAFHDAHREIRSYHGASAAVAHWLYMIASSKDAAVAPDEGELALVW